MRLIKVFLAVISVFFFLASCQKEMSLEQGLSEGTLKEDGTGNCLPSTVNGIFKEDSTLTASNFIEVQLNITQTGTYIIKSDTINGYSFYGGGSIEATGINTIRLYAHGKPTDPGVNQFTIRYDSSSCIIDVPVVTVGPSGSYTLGGSGSNCTGVTLSGIYMAGVPVAGNTATVNVTVTTAGSYSMSTPVVNGISFSATGDFTTTGAQTVTLIASGTPTAAGTSNFLLSANSSSCTFSVPVTAAAGPAVFTLGGAGSSCTGFVSAGTYTSGMSLTAANTVTVNVNVTTVGAYALSTTLANGVTFSKLGIFTLTGPQTVTLTGSGTPTAAGAITHTLNAPSGNCSFTITYAGGAGPAAYTLSGAPGACTAAIVAGTYNAGTALNATNTVTVQVNVTTVGAYTLSTNTVNGMTFSKTGSFITTGIQTVILNGSGTPAAAGASVLTPVIGSSSCTFTVTVTSTAPTDFIVCTINGVVVSFNDNPSATYFTPNQDLGIDGLVNSTSSSEEMFLEIDKSISGGTITTGTYTMAGTAAGVYNLYAEYVDPSGGFWDPRDVPSGSPDPFTITITSLTATRVSGTFSGTVRSNAGTGTTTKTITSGSFSVPIF